MKYKKQNIEIVNENYFDKVEELEDCIKLYSDDALQFIVYHNSVIVAKDSFSVVAKDSSTLHAYRSTKVYANDCSTVHAYHNSMVHAKNNTSVYAYGGSTVYTSDNSIVYAYDSSIVTACDSSIVYAYDSSIVNAYHNSMVYANDSSKVTACDSSIVYMYEFSTLYIYNSEVKINAINHFGAVIKQVHKLKKDILVYKKLQDDKIATLKLVKGQTFQSERFSKCRTDKALVVAITNIANTEEYQDGVSVYNNNFKYEVGKEVIANGYDKTIEECSNGIHFFLTREKAEKYEV